MKHRPSNKFCYVVVSSKDNIAEESILPYILDYVTFHLYVWWNQIFYHFPEKKNQ